MVLSKCMYVYDFGFIVQGGKISKIERPKAIEGKL